MKSERNEVIWEIYETIFDGDVVALKPPEICPLQRRIEDIYRLTGGLVQPGVWSQKPLEFEIFGDLVDELCDFMRAAGADISVPVEKDFERSINLALAEVTKAVGVVGEVTTPNFGVHHDNHTGVSCDVWTLIFYVCCTAVGGGLEIFETRDSRFATVACSGAVVIKGDVWHRPESIFGEGERGAVIFQFPAREQT